MKNSYSVVIEKRHCIGADYGNIIDCPLFRAIREQLPEFPLHSVGGFVLTDKNLNNWKMEANSEGIVEWGETINIGDILSGKVYSHTVTFTWNPEEEGGTKPWEDDEDDLILNN